MTQGDDLNTTMDLPPRIGPYRPLFRLGQGGMGQVIAARSDGFMAAELVAIKRLAPRFGVDHAAVVALLDEARAVSRVSHPNVIALRDVGHDSDGSPYLVMELVVGADLARITRMQAPLPVPVALEWMAQVAEGLSAVHRAADEKGQHLALVHRDVSPHNVLVGTDGRARLSDFGIALSTERMQQATRSGAIKGKIRYMSPEQLEGRPLTDRSDVFSLGVVAWEALVGKPLFDATEPSRTLEQMRRLDVQSPHEVRSDVPEAAASVVMRALAREPGQRPTAAEFAAGLRRIGMPPQRAELAAVVAPVAVSGVADLRSSLERTWSGMAERIASEGPERTRVLRTRRIVVLAGLLAGGLTLALLGTTCNPGSALRPTDDAPHGRQGGTA